MPARRSGLGRGLEALIGGPPRDAGTPDSLPGSSEEDAAGTPLEVELGRIERNPRQPRRQMDEQQLADLADSVREHGLLQPLVVTRIARPSGGSTAGGSAVDSAADGGANTREAGPPRYRLIAGERRWQAAKIAGLVRVPVVLRDVTPRELLELALVENVQRADLNAVEEATAYQQLAEEFGMTQEQIGRRVGKSRFAVANTLRLLHLPAAVQQAVVDGQISEGHARAILGLADAETQRQVTRLVIEQGLSVRQTEELVRRQQPPPPPDPEDAASAPRLAGSRSAGRPTAPDVLEIEDRFRDALGTKVSLTRTKRGGRLTIFYYDDEQLKALYDRMATE
ncbi:MAG: ParB/RepB/Spo0J family partition protein [Chloroflexota bacterium]|nr:ParB/RepB/Spo0J family partition protein [Chloroflexota bacterium]